MQTIIDCLPGLFFILDREGRCLRWNRGAEAILACSADEVRGQPALQWVVPEDRTKAKTAFKKAFAGKRLNCELRIQNTAGGKRFFHTEGVLATFNKQQLLVGLAVDISEQKKIEHEMQRQRNQMAHMQRLTALGELTGALVHELNQPLTAILSNAQAAQRFLQAERPDLDEIQNILEDIVADDKRASEVIQGLRGFLKQDDLHRQPVDINAAIGEILGLINGGLIIRGIKIVSELAPEQPEVLANRVQLQQIMLNLIINAAEAMQGLAPEQRRVSVITVADRASVSVAVRDCGAGIDPDRLEFIFQAFFTTKHDGMGMGLAISRSIIEAHGGRLWGYNNSDCGATFRFTLPVVRYREA